jgi:hypothetical protein
VILTFYRPSTIDHYNTAKIRHVTNMEYCNN